MPRRSVMRGRRRSSTPIRSGRRLFLDAPEVEGIESMTLDQTTIRLVARVRPTEQGPVARELRGRIRVALAARRPASEASTDRSTPPA